MTTVHLSKERATLIKVIQIISSLNIKAWQQSNKRKSKLSIVIFKTTMEAEDVE